MHAAAPCSGPSLTFGQAEALVALGDEDVVLVVPADHRAGRHHQALDRRVSISMVASMAGLRRPSRLSSSVRTRTVRVSGLMVCLT